MAIKLSLDSYQKELENSDEKVKVEKSEVKVDINSEKAVNLFGNNNNNSTIAEDEVVIENENDNLDNGKVINYHSNISLQKYKY